MSITNIYLLPNAHLLSRNLAQTLYRKADTNFVCSVAERKGGFYTMEFSSWYESKKEILLSGPFYSSKEEYSGSKLVS
jgi:hypothetical protein